LRWGGLFCGVVALFHGRCWGTLVKFVGAECHGFGRLRGLGWWGWGWGWDWGGGVCGFGVLGCGARRAGVMVGGYQPRLLVGLEIGLWSSGLSGGTGGAMSGGVQVEFFTMAGVMGE